MDVLAHHPCPLMPGHHLTRWRIGDVTLEARWQPPLQLLTVRIARDHGDASANRTGSPHGNNRAAQKDALMLLLAWLSCEKASSELALDDPLQAALALAIMTLKAESLHKAGFQDERPAGGDNVSPLRTGLQHEVNLHFTDQEAEHGTHQDQ